jgi:hypothetical protein
VTLLFVTVVFAVGFLSVNPRNEHGITKGNAEQSIIFFYSTCLFIRRPESSYQALNNILAPFNKEFWFALQGAMIVLAGFLSLASYLGRCYGCPETPDLYTLPRALLCVFEIFCQQGNFETFWVMKSFVCG